MNTEPKTQLPAIQPFYDEDGITIYCGDNRRILPMIDAQDLLLTDPPYGLNLGNDLWDTQRGKLAKSDWDANTAEEWTMLLARRLCQKQIIWGGNYYVLPVSRCWLSWYKPDAPPSMGNVEYAWTNLDQNSRQIEQSVAATNGERVGHPTQKPLRVINWALQLAGEVRTMLDPWMGSGTSLVAAKLAGMRAIGIEVNETYCKLAVKRLAQGVLRLDNAKVSSGDDPR
jgi:DNA modification methylase